jgi:hypothetical protein
MVEQVQKRVIDEYGQRLASLWIDGLTVSGRLGFEANEKARRELIEKAEGLGIRAEVYSRANDIMNGR